MVYGICTVVIAPTYPDRRPTRGAAYPRASGGPPSTLAQGTVVPLLTLLRVGFTKPPQSPALVAFYTTVNGQDTRTIATVAGLQMA
jgi:hypothetical protein